MERTVRGGERQAYTAAVTDLWERVGTALTRLDRVADSTSEELVDEHAEELPGLEAAYAALKADEERHTARDAGPFTTFGRCATEPQGIFAELQ